MFSIGINSNNSVNSHGHKPQLLFSIPKTEQAKISQRIIFAFPNGLNFSTNEIKPKIYSIFLRGEREIKEYLYILLFYEKISEIYCPISIVLTSNYAKVDFFKELLKHIYQIIKFDISLIYNYKCDKINIKNPLFIQKDLEKIKSYQKMELLNYLNFCSTILRPPNKSILTLETRYDKIKCKFQSLKEIPTSDYCIEVLFDSLEISVIIKLFIALLFEKHIIILANQDMLLFCICESMMRLIFPFRWLYTYIINLPKDKSEMLEIKRPYLIGINSDKIKADELINKFPSNIICDVHTSTLYGNTSNLKLPFNEEMKIKTKLLLLKDKFRNNYDEFDIEENIGNSNELYRKESEDKYEDIDFNLSFAENVHNIFFRIFKNSLMDIKKDYIINDVFDSQKFLDSFDEEEYKLFFEKIIVTSAFDYFISSMKFLDNSLSMKFNLIYYFAISKLKGKANKIIYNEYTLTIPKKLELIENENVIHNEFFEIKEQNLSFLFDNYNEISAKIDDNINKYHKDSFNSITTKDLKHKAKRNKNSKYSCINFYGKDGFIEFAQNYETFINYNNILLNEIMLLYNHFFSKHSTNEETCIINISNKDIYLACYLIALFFYIFLSNKFKNIIQQLKPIKSKNNENNINQTFQKENSKNNEIKKETIFNLLLKYYKRNQDEFPRNLFITMLQSLSLEELKKLKLDNSDTKHPTVIDKTIQYQILKTQKISYESMVIQEPDNEDENNKIKEHNINTYLDMAKTNSGDFDLNNPINGRKLGKKRKTSMETNFIFINEIFPEKKNQPKGELDPDSNEDEKENYQKTKLNVLGDKNKCNDGNESRLLSKSNNQPSNNNKPKYMTMKNIYKLSKRNNSGLKSWNNIENLSNPTQSQIFSTKTTLNIDPMEISEKICVKLYSYLCSKKIENFTVKNNDINSLNEISHSKTFDELKNLILSLRSISLDALAASKNNYYCFWLNLYNFLTIFSIIYKSEIVSNLYEWLRFLKNSYFTIGNVEISLLEIEAIILRDKNIIKNIYGISINNEKLKLPKIDKFDPVINFGISLSTISSPDIRIYYPCNFLESLKYSATLFFSKNLKIDLENETIEIPEYLNMIEPNFNFGMESYKEYFEEDFLKLIKEKPIFKIIIKKFNWNLDFSDFKNY